MRITVSIPRPLAEAAKKAAIAERRALSNWIACVIEASLKAKRSTP